jgi:hypothetical protein
LPASPRRIQLVAVVLLLLVQSAASASDNSSTSLHFDGLNASNLNGVTHQLSITHVE